MGTVYIPARCVRSIDSEVSKEGRRMGLELDMSEAMMFEALNAMLAHVSGDTWAQWVDKINRETDPGYSVPDSAPTFLHQVAG